MEAPTELMQESIAFKVIRGIFCRAAWVLLYVLHLALIVIAFSMFFGVVLVAFDKGGGGAGASRRHVTVGQRCAMGLLHGSVGLLCVAGALKLKQCHRRINPLYPEMQIGFHLARATERERPPQVHRPPSADPLYDRDLDGGL
jgi:hypothetical protein